MFVGLVQVMPGLGFTEGPSGLIPSNSLTVFFSMIESVAVGTGAILTLLSIRELVFQKRKKGTKRNFVVYLVTGQSSVKMQQIRANPKVSAYFCKPAEFHTLMLRGQVQEITDQEFKKELWQDGWERYFPKGVEDPDYTVLQLSPRSACGLMKGEAFRFPIGSES